MYNILLPLILLSPLPPPTVGQPASGALRTAGAVSETVEPEDDSKLMAIPFASYGPETGWLGGVAGLYLFQLDGRRFVLITSSLVFSSALRLASDAS